MKTVTRKFYQCSICDEEYSTKKEALSCESKPVSKDRGVKVGDTVLITGGQSTGKQGKVTRKWIIDKYWGHYAWERYWHTVVLEVDVIDSWGSRMLTFDNYKVIK